MSAAALKTDPFSARDTFETGSGQAGIYRLSKLEDAGLGNVAALPYSIRVLLESLLRNCDGYVVTEDDVRALAGWQAAEPAQVEIPFKPARVVLQDFTGVPCVVDLAAMRSAMERLGGDPKKINPLVPVDLVIDHSVQVDYFNSAEALDLNIDMEFSRNRERYEFLRWGQKAFDNFRVVPPGTGIVHQVNLEYLAKVVFLGKDDAGPVAFPDSLVGTDSHTTMIDGLGVVGWGVGGIEAEGVMLGQPIYMLLPEVVGMELTGQLPPGATATDLVLTVTEMLRKEKVVGKFVEFFGPGVSTMALADRATIGNMSPEYGATMGFFPVDEQTLRYLRQTGRTETEVELVERYTKEQGLFRTDSGAGAEVHQGGAARSVDRRAEPGRAEAAAGPHSAVEHEAGVAAGAAEEVYGKQRGKNGTPEGRWEGEGGHDVEPAAAADAEPAAPPADPGFDGVEVEWNGEKFELKHGDVVIAAITSCTNTSNPSVMVAAGLLAKKAVERGLKVPPHVKTSLAPGSPRGDRLLRQGGARRSTWKAWASTRSATAARPASATAARCPSRSPTRSKDNDLVVAGVLSGNRNFEGRINPDVKANYLASPPLVVAYALAGTTDIDFDERADRRRQERLAGVSPRHLAARTSEVQAVVDTVRPARDVRQAVRRRLGQEPEVERDRDQRGRALRMGGREHVHPGAAVSGRPARRSRGPIEPIRGARCLAALGDSVTTDHISPAGSIAKDSPAGKYLMALGVEPRDFNSYGARRGNDRVMTRGTFANIRIRNQLAPGTEGGVTRHLPDGEVMPIYDAAMKYKARRRAAGRAGRRGIRHGLEPRLGRQGGVPARRAGRARRQLRADPPQQPGRHGRVAAGIRGRQHAGSRSA